MNLKIVARPLQLTIDGNQVFAVNCRDPRLQEHIRDPRIAMTGERVVLVIGKNFTGTARSLIRQAQGMSDCVTKSRRLVSEESVEITNGHLGSHWLNGRHPALKKLLDLATEIHADRLVLQPPNEDRFAAWLGRMYFRPYCQNPIPIEPEVLTPEQLGNLGKCWSEIKLSDRTRNSLEMIGHTHIWQTAEKTEAELRKNKVGRKILIEITEVLVDFGLCLGMVVPNEVKAKTD